MKEEASQAKMSTPRTQQFRARFFPDTTDLEWNDWRWQLRHRLQDLDSLQRIISVTSDERDAISRHTGPLPIGISPYYASLLDEFDAQQPLRRTVVKSGAEYLKAPEEFDDPLSEDKYSPVPGLVHRYADRVLFLVTGFCPVYCRYCTRSRLVGEPGGEYTFNTQQWERAIDYIEHNTGIRDVILSGGDPLTLSDERLGWLLSRLRRIPHVEVLRVGTKVPVALPQRITTSLVKVLQSYPPLWVSIHFTHPDELTPEVSQACKRLADAGIPLISQSVLLAGINDNEETLRDLFQGLLKMRVMPYYLYQCDFVSGSSHFRTSIDKGLEILRKLRGSTSGFAIPTYVVDLPAGGGKVPLSPNFIVGREGENLLIKNHEGRAYLYKDASEFPD